MQERKSSDTSSSLLHQFNQSINPWIDALDNYSYEDLVSRPKEGWSLGQLYTHLIEEARFYLDQIRVCVSTNDNADGELNQEGHAMLTANSFPEHRIAGAPDHALMSQPETREQLQEEMVLLRDEMNEAARWIAETEFSGKTQHPGLGYFSAADWLQFAGMHFRHHLRQKSRLDHFIANVSQ